MKMSGKYRYYLKRALSIILVAIVLATDSVDIVQPLITYAAPIDENENVAPFEDDQVNSGEPDEESDEEPDTDSKKHEHNYIYKSNGDGTHTAICEVEDCGSEIIEECDFVDSKCVKCGESKVYKGEDDSNTKEYEAKEYDARKSPDAGIALLSLEADEVPNGVNLLVNGHKMEDGKFVIHYGDLMKLSMDTDEDWSLEYLYAEETAVEDGPWKDIDTEAICVLNPGFYYLGYSNDRNYIGDFYKLEVTTAKLKKPDNLSVNEDLTLSWDITTKTETGNITESDTKFYYSIELYKVSDTIDVADKMVMRNDNASAAENESRVHFAMKDTIEEEGYGQYYFKVKTLSNISKYTDSEWAISDKFEYRDSENPVVLNDSYKATFSSNHDECLLEIDAKDVHTGIVQYAFSTRDDIAPENEGEIDWIDSSEEEAAKDTEVTFTYNVPVAGEYFFYAKDKAGNLSRSEKAITITKIIYENYYIYSSTAKQENVNRFYAEDALPSVLLSTVRRGYTFNGWYIKDSSTKVENETISELIEKGSDNNLEASWSRYQFDVKILADGLVSDKEKKYDKSPVVLTVNVEGSEDVDEIIYTWYKDGEQVSEESSSSFYVKNVDQSGTYNVKVELKAAGEEDATSTSSGINVTITPRALVVKAEKLEKEYGYEFNSDDFTPSYEGLVEGDEESVTVGKFIASDYTQGNAINEYEVRPENFESSNYSITAEPSNSLKIVQKEITDEKVESCEISVELSENEYIYDGSEKNPVITINDNVFGELSDSRVLVKDRDYTVSFNGTNINAGEATATINFTGNYKGTIEKKFVIKKASYEIEPHIASSWKYADYNKSMHGPSIEVSGCDISVPSEKIHYFFRTVNDDSSVGEWAESMPENAGNYQMMVKIDELDNYEELSTESSPKDFEIKKRIIILQSSSAEWIYDGNEHSVTNVTYPISIMTAEGEVFADGLGGSDNFKDCTAITKISEVTAETGVDNEISYEFNTRTNPDNYTIIKDKGKLKIIQAVLNPPANNIWSNHEPGTATWIAVTKQDLDVEYKVHLYSNNKGVIELIKNENTDENGAFTTRETKINFADIIKGREPQSYYFTVQACPVGGAAENDYRSSAYSGNSAYLHSAKVRVEKTNVDSSDVASVSIETDKSEQIMIAGESASIDAVLAQGYVKDEVTWSASAVTTTYAQSDISKLTIADNTSLSTTVKIAANMEHPAEYRLVAHGVDENPYIEWSFDDYKFLAPVQDSTICGEDINIHIEDSISLSQYAIVRYEAEMTETQRESIDDGADWINVSGSVKGEDGVEKFDTTYRINDSGYYYVGVKDGKGQIVWSDPCIVYKISFEKGHDDAEGTMSSILKIKDYDIFALPSEQFVRDGFAFTEWESSTTKKVFVNGGKYADNQSAVLNAKWSDVLYSYTVNYFYMNKDGEYPVASSETDTFKVLYNYNVKYDGITNDPKKDMVGLVFDHIVIEGQDEEVQSCDLGITDNSTVINIYYRRNRWNISYSYTDIDGNIIPLDDEKEVNLVYGSTLGSAEPAKPVRKGFTFVGWKYDVAGSRPKTMPNHDVVATGSFVANEATYKVNYYLEGLSDSRYNNFALDSVESFMGIHDEEKEFRIDDPTYVKDIEGFTVSKVWVTKGLEGAPNGYASAKSDKDSGKLISVSETDEDKEILQVNYYYTRNTKKIYLNVWQGDHSEGTQGTLNANEIYEAYWEYLYGEDISDVTNIIETYYENNVAKTGSVSASNKPKNELVPETEVNLNGYKLTTYKNWSTGSVPTTMPSEDVVVTREYVNDNDREYLVTVYLQNPDGDGSIKTYIQKTSLKYFAKSGSIVKFEDDLKSPVPKENRVEGTIYASQFKNMIDGLTHYSLNTEHEGNVLTITMPTVEAAKTDVPEIVVYFDRAIVKATVKYYYNNVQINVDSENKTLEDDIYEGVWGAALDINPLKYFDRNVTNIDETSNTNSYRTNNCVVAYEGSYRINGGTSYPVYRFIDINNEGGETYDPSSDKYYLDSKLPSGAGNTVVRFGQNDSTTINVYYNTVEETAFDLGVKRNVLTKENKEGSVDNRFDVTVPAGHKYAGYTFRVVNEYTLYKLLSGSSDTYVKYPGLTKQLKVENPSYTTDPESIDYALKEGYKDITEDINKDFVEKFEYTQTINGDYKYFIKEGDLGKTIYVTRTGYNNLYKGNRYSFGFPKENYVYQIVNNYIEKDYNVNNPNPGVYIWSNNSSGVWYGGTENRNVVFSFENKATYHIYHNIAGNECNGHEFVTGTKFETEDSLIHYNNGGGDCAANAERLGYELKWFDDANYTKSLTTVPEGLNGNKVLYGNYYKKVCDYKQTIHYEISVDGKLFYIDESDIQPDAERVLRVAYLDPETGHTIFINGIRKIVSESTEIDTITDGIGNSTEYKPTTTTYTDKDGNVLLLVESKKSYTFEEVNLDYADSKYLQPHFNIDKAKPQNILNAYVEDDSKPVSLDAYFARDKFELTIKPGFTEDNRNSKYSYGQSVFVENPVKPGYKFNHWEFYEADEDKSEGAKIEDIHSETVEKDGKKYTEFVMPDKALIMKAVWDRDEFEIIVDYLFQTVGKQYREDLISKVKTDTSSDEDAADFYVEKPVTVSFDGIDTTMTGYYEGDELRFVSDGDHESGKHFYLISKVSDSQVKVDSVDLFAYQRFVKYISEADLSSIDHSYENEYFVYDHGICHNGKEIIEINSDNEIQAMYGMSVDFYYTRNTNLEINLVKRSVDNGDINATLTTSVSEGIVYGDVVTISEKSGSGYTFKGWYLASEVIDGYYKADGVTISDTWKEASIKEDISSIDPISENSQYTFKLSRTMNLVAVYEPNGIVVPSITVSSEINSYDYGYLPKELKNIHAGVVFPEGTDQNVYIKGYKWVMVDAAGNELGAVLTDNLSSDYKIEPGLDATEEGKPYRYVCKVEVGRKDTGRSIVIESSPYEITVNKINFPLEAKDYEGIYDGFEHGISLIKDVSHYDFLNSFVEGTDYDIYYSTSPIPSDVVGNEGYLKTEPIKCKDVVVNESNEVIPVDVYYAVIPKSEKAIKNINTTISSNHILIKPRELNIRETIYGFSKVFDNNTLVAGSLVESENTTEKTDKYRLSYGENGRSYYAITGWVSGEETDLTLDFEANYNSKHVTEAGSIELTDLKIVYKENDQIDKNYVFPTGTKLTIPGHITQKIVDIDWSAGEKGHWDEDSSAFIYVYDGDVHRPVPSISPISGVTLSLPDGKINSGDYHLNAELAKDGESDAMLSDYRLNNQSCNYRILVTDINVKAFASEATYDTNNHSNSQMEITTAGGTVTINPGESITIDGKTYQVSASFVGFEGGSEKSGVVGYKNAGEYQMIPYNVHLLNSEGKDVTDNFTINREPGDLVIKPAKIVVSGIKAENKIYDGTASATLVYDKVTFTGVYPGDSIKLNTEDEVAPKIIGTFVNESDIADKSVGNDKKVLITLKEGALLDSNTDKVSINYVIKKDDDKEVQTAYTTASITQLTAELVPNDIDDMVYGGDVPFSVEPVEELLKNDDTLKVWGELKFNVKNKVNNNEYSYTYSFEKASSKTVAEIKELTPLAFGDMALDAGEYEFTIDVSKLQSDNYQFTSSQGAVIKVTPKEVTAVERTIDDVTKISKEYDGTANVDDSKIDYIKAYANTYLEFVGVLSKDEATFGIDSCKAIYDDSNVYCETYPGGAQHIRLTEVETNNANYVIKDKSASIMAKITPKELTLTANDVSIVYGTGNDTLKDDFDITQDGLVNGGGVSESLENVIDKTKLIYTSEYDSTNPEKRNVTGADNKYGLTLGGAEGIQKDGKGNYSIVYAPGHIEVTKKLVNVYVEANPDYIEGTVKYNAAATANDDFSMTYGGNIDYESFKPVFGDANTGFAYEDSVKSLGIDIVNFAYLIKVENKDLIIGGTGSARPFPTIQGNYKINPVVSDLNASTSSGIQNYKFEAVSDKWLYVSRKIIHLDKNIIRIANKVYDATTDVSGTQIRLGKNDWLKNASGGNIDAIVTSTYNYDYLNNIAFDASGEGIEKQILDRDIEALLAKQDTGLKFNLTNTKYAENLTKPELGDKDIGEHNVILDFELSDYLKDRYQIDSNYIQKVAISEITPRPLEIKATVTPATVKYGESMPVFSNIYDSFAGTEDIRVLVKASEGDPELGQTRVYGKTADGDLTGEVWTTSYSGATGTYSHVVEAKYMVIPSGFVAGANGNYMVSYTNCDITVEPNKLATPKVIWDSVDENPGTVSFEKVDAIGDVVVDHYEMSLWKKAVGASDYVEIVGASVSDAKPNTGEAPKKYDLKETLRANGAGDYIVKVKAIAKVSEAYNPIVEETGKKLNVLDSDFGETTKVMHVAEVSLVLNDDVNTVKAKVKAIDASESNNNSIILAMTGKETDASKLVAEYSKTSTDPVVPKVILVEGEKDIKVRVDLKDAVATGYLVANLISENKGVVINDNHVQNLDGSKKREYTGDFSLGELTSSQPITVKVKLEPEKVAISAKLFIIDRDESGAERRRPINKYDLKYNYTQPPTLEVEVGVKTGSKDTTDDYTFSYVWKMKTTRTAYAEIEGNVNDNNITKLSFPLGKNKDQYTLICSITATRKDNGESETHDTTALINKDDGKFVIAVNSAPLEVSVNLNKILESGQYGWKYGETRGELGVAGKPADYTKDPKYYYSKSDNATGTFTTTQKPEGWMDKMPTDVGEWYVLAYMPQDSNYLDSVTAPVKYIITKNTLNPVSNIIVKVPQAGDTNTYGDVAWDAPATIYENAGTGLAGEVSDSKVVPYYGVSLYKVSGNNSSETTDILEERFKNVAANKVNIAEVINTYGDGSYKLVIKAIPNKNSEKDCNNCNESESREIDFIVGKVEGESFTKEYDGSDLELSAEYSGTPADYQWYKEVTGDGAVENEAIAVTGATDKILPLRYVEDSGTYFCVATVNGKSCITTKKQVTITPRPIKVKTASADKVYDGTKLTTSGKADEFVLSYAGTVPGITEALASSAGGKDIETHSITGEALTVDTPAKTNTYADFVIKTADTAKVLYTLGGSENNYKIVEEDLGRLTITPLPVELGWVVDDSYGWNGFEATYNGYTRKIKAEIQNVKTKVTSGTADDVSVATYENNSGISAFDYTGENAAKALTLSGSDSKNYTLVNGSGISKEWKINKAVLNITAASQTWTYDGAEHTYHQYESVAGLADGDLIDSSDVNSVIYSADSKVKNVTTVDVDNIITKVVVKRDNAGTKTDVSANYTLNATAGKLKVIKAEQMVSFGSTVETSGKSIEYDGKAHGSTSGELVATATGVSGGTAVGNIIYYEIESENGSPKVDSDDKYVVKEELGNSFSKNDAGTYFIRAKVADTSDYNEAYSNVVKLEITKRKIKITANSDEKIYDGSALNNSGFVVSYNGSTSGATALGEGDEVHSVTVEGSQTNVNTSIAKNNIAKDAILVKISDATKDVTNNYDISYEMGLLKVNPRSLGNGSTYTSGITVDNIDDYTYAKTAYEPTVVVKDNGLVSEPSGITLTKGTNGQTGTDYYVSYSNNINAGTATVTINGQGNYKGSITKTFTIKPKVIDLTWTGDSLGVTYPNGVWDSSFNTTYIGMERVVSAAVNNKCGDDEVYVSSYTNSGRQVNKATNANAGEENYTAEAKELGGEAKDNYTLTGCTSLKQNWVINPKVLVDDDLTISPTSFEFGTEIGPTIEVKVDLNGVTSDAHEETIALNSDYTITNDSDNHIQPLASSVGTYIVQINGKGNYKGSVSKEYTINDTVPAVIKGKSSVKAESTLADGQTYTYCRDATISITDKNLSEVKIEVKKPDDADFSELEAPVTSFSLGKYEKSLVAYGTDVSSYTEYRITIKDLRSKNADGTDAYNTQTVGIKIYPDHEFREEDYIVNDSLTPSGIVSEAQCCHTDCSQMDYIIKPRGEVKWKYNYSYEVTNSTPQSGNQKRGERETYAVVLLKRGDELIASKVVDCTVECKDLGRDDDEATKSYSFEVDSAGNHIPYKDAAGNLINYTIEVHPIAHGGSVDNYTVITNYKVTNLKENINEHFVEIDYRPNLFEVPWKVTLTNLPKIVDSDGNVTYIKPEEIFVKVIYAKNEDDTDEHYAIITQHSRTDSSSSMPEGVKCDAVDLGNGTFVYEGEYPCWVEIGATGQTYYHRIQVTGYKLDGVEYDIEDENLRSICDKDHVNHTIIYDEEKDQASGVILYELSGLLPSVILDRNDGSKKTHAVIYKGMDAFDVLLENPIVTLDEIHKVGTPSRSGYNFLGWFSEPVGGEQLTEDIILGKKSITYYAHWAPIPKKDAEPEGPADKDDQAGDNNDVEWDDNPTDGDGENSYESILQPVKSPSPKPTVSPVKLESPKPTGSPANPKASNNKDNGKDKADTTPSNKPSSSPTKTPDKDDIISDLLGNNNGQLEVIVEKTNKPKVEDKDKNEIAKAVLTEKEIEILEQGGKVVIRLTVDDTNKKEPTKKENPNLYKFMDSLVESEDEKAVFKSFVDLRLEKSINDSEWERILESREEIEIVIDIPEEYVLGARRVHLAKKDSDGNYILIEDMDDNDYTFTIKTNDFDSEYVIVTIEDNKVALANIAFDNCIWHWFIIASALIYLLMLLITMKKKDEEENDNDSSNNSRKESSNENENSLEDMAKKSTRNRMISVIGYALLLIIFTYLGECKWEVPLDIITSIIVCGTEYGTYKHKFKELKEEKKNSNSQ